MVGAPGAAAASCYDGADAATLAARLGVPRLALLARVGSTQDVAHALAADGAPEGTLVLADAQEAGRGRQGRRWASEAGAGIWMTFVTRPDDPAALEVLSLRLGIAAAEVLDPFAGAPVALKWPNDLQVGSRKLAGILVEARWRDGRPEWVAVGFGLNVRAPADLPTAVGLRADARRLDVLDALVPALRAAARRTGPLDDTELAAYAGRDAVRGRRCVAPAEGVVQGITAAGELLVATLAGERRVRAGSLVLAEGAC